MSSTLRVNSKNNGISAGVPEVREVQQQGPGTHYWVDPPFDKRKLVKGRHRGCIVIPVIVIPDIAVCLSRLLGSAAAMWRLCSHRNC